MKNYCLGMLLAGVIAAPVFAQMGSEEENNVDLATEYFKASDTDKDGKITYDELIKLNAAMVKELKEAGESEEKQGAVHEKYAFVLDIYNFTLSDANDDKAVSVDEMKAYLKVRDEGKEVKYSAKDVDVISDFTWDTSLVHYDKNNDGNIAKDELPENYQEEFSGYDKDGDGKVTKDEFREVMRSAMGEYTEKGTEPKETPKETPAVEGEIKKELFALYTKEGRTWTIKNTVSMSGMDPMITYMKTEVVKVGDDFAEIKMTMLDKDKKPMAGMEPTTTKISFRVPKASGTPKETPKVESKDETIKVEAGEFECTMTTSETNGYKTTVWISKETAGLMVKSTTTGGGAETVCELVEFKD